MMRRLVLVVCLLMPLTAWAQAYDWHLLDLADPHDPARQVTLLRVTNGDELLVTARRLAYRASPGPVRTLTPLTCTGLPHNPTSSRQGPDFRAVNNAGLIVGNDDLVIGGRVVLAAITLAADGACTAFRVPGSVNTVYTTVADDGSKAGWYQGPDPSLGLRRFKGFSQAPDGTVTTLEGLCPSAWIQPADRNTNGTMVGNALCNIQPDNSYVPTAWALRGGAWQVLLAPNGQPLTLVSVNNAERAAAYTPTEAWIIDLTTTPPTFTPMPSPPAQSGGTVVRLTPRQLSDLNWLLVHTDELRPGCPQPEHPIAQCEESHQWLGIPTAPPAPPEVPKKKSRWERKDPTPRQHLKRRWEVEQATENLGDGLQPVVEEDGTVVLSDGERVLGREERD